MKFMRYVRMGTGGAVAVVMSLLFLVGLALPLTLGRFLLNRLERVRIKIGGLFHRPAFQRQERVEAPLSNTASDLSAR
jgi:cobalamin synthase